MSTPAPSFRQRLGCWLHERWRTELVLRAPGFARAFGLSWLDLCNRDERVRVDQVSGGRICEWRDSSRLTVARIFPETAPQLLAHVLALWPIRLKAAKRVESTPRPVVSILIPMGGTERLPQFELALLSARAQTEVAFEVIVVEQAPAPTLQGRIDPSVRYLFQLSTHPGGFNKSSALNLAARNALGDVLIVLDADYLLPERFAAECVRVLQRCEAARPARWIFYLDRFASEQVASFEDCAGVKGIELIVSNNPTPLAIRRSTYWEIGGHDESYVGWGGEDTEFLDRLRTRNISEGGWMPVLHVWHAPAPQKADGDRNRAHHEATMARPPGERIAVLSSGAR